MKKAIKIVTAQGNPVVLCPCHISSIEPTGGIKGDYRIFDIRMCGGESYQYGVICDTDNEGLVYLAKSLGLS